jgi:RNA polymerase sigma-70 factor (ECF subfamily)
MREQIHEEITTAMATLPERQRMATVLFELEGLPIKDIARMMDCSEGAVKFSIHEGRKKLKRRLIHLVEGLRWGRRHSESLSGIRSSQFGLRKFASSQFDSSPQADSRESAADGQ